MCDLPSRAPAHMCEDRASVWCCQLALLPCTKNLTSLTFSFLVSKEKVVAQMCLQGSFVQQNCGIREGLRDDGLDCLHLWNVGKWIRWRMCSPSISGYGKSSRRGQHCPLATFLLPTSREIEAQRLSWDSLGSGGSCSEFVCPQSRFGVVQPSICELRDHCVIKWKEKDQLF